MVQQRDISSSTKVSAIQGVDDEAPLEVECANCDLDPMCSILDYANADSGVPEGILLRHRYLSRGETIFRKDDPFRSLFTVKSGSFKTYVPSGDGGEQVVGFHLFGELMGAEGLSGGFYPHTTRALESGAVCELRLDNLPQSGRSQDELQRGIVQLLSTEISFNRQLMAAMIHQSAEQRVLGFLMNLSQRLESKGMPYSHFRLGMSRSDIGNYLGLASETVSRILTKLQKTGVIELRRKRLTLFNPGEPRKVAKG